MNRSSKGRHSVSEERRHRWSDYRRVHQEDEYDIYQNTNSSDTYSLQPVREIYVEKTIEPGDTLLSLSLQFNCTISELKRINHIIRDNEIFARRIIKVPVRPGSVVAERIARVHTNGASKTVENESASCSTEILSLNDTDCFTNDSLDIPKEDTVFSTLRDLGSQSSGKSEETVNIASSTPLVGYSSLPISEDSPEETVTSPLLPHEHSSQVSDEIESLKCNGADWGLSWLQLLICALLLGCAGPVLYVFFITERKHAN